MLWLPIWIVIALSLAVCNATEAAVDIEKADDNVNIGDSSSGQDEKMRIPGFDQELAPEEFMKMFDSMSEDERNEILKSFGSGKSGMKNNLLPAAGNNFFYQIGVLLSLLSVIGVIIVFIGYKLYNSLKEKERRRELKKQQKELKKRK